MKKNNNLNELVEQYRSKEQNTNNSAICSLFFIGLDLVIGTSLGFTIGFVVDNYLHTKPTFMIVLSLIGSFLGFKRIFKS